MPITQEELDEWFPTFVRYLGVALTVVLITASILGKNDYPSAYIAAAGMILYKSIGNGRYKKRDKGEREDDDEKWSHLP